MSFIFISSSVFNNNDQNGVLLSIGNDFTFIILKQSSRALNYDTNFVKWLATFLITVTNSCWPNFWLINHRAEKHYLLLRNSSAYVRRLESFHHWYYTHSVSRTCIYGKKIVVQFVGGVNRREWY